MHVHSFNQLHLSIRICLLVVSFAVDALKDTDEDGSKVARIANRWFEPNKMGASFKPAIQLLRKEDKLPLENMEYPLVHTPESLSVFFFS